MAKPLNPLSKNQRIHWLTGRMSWRVTLTAFITIVLVQALALYLTITSYQQMQLDQLAQMGKGALTPMLMEANGAFVTNLSQPLSNRLLNSSPIRGLAFYLPDNSKMQGAYGEITVLRPDVKNPEMKVAQLSDDKTRYEISFGPRAMKAPYIVIMRLDSQYVSDRVFDYILTSVITLLLLSALTTIVLIFVLGKWIIEPILILRNNLLGAAREPTAPFRYITSYRRRDELGSVISSANKLIKLNAENFDRLNRHAQDKIYRVAFYDALTNLPNRAHFLNKLEEIVEGRAIKSYEKIGILVVDIDHFGDVNDTLGYEAGDMLLKDVAVRLGEVLSDVVLLARISEDEFAAILNFSEISDIGIDETAQKVLGIFSETFSILGNDLVLEASVGMALWPDNAHESADLLKKAESALDQAKLEQTGNFRLYSPSFDQAVHNRIQIVRDLRMAIEEKQFKLVYQPQLKADTLEVIGAEALLRWERVDLETGNKAFVRPDHFIPIAEQSGLIVPIGRWVVEEACRFAKQCQDEGMKAFRIAVNLSGIQFHRDDVVALVRDVLARTGLAPHLLELEVTESAVMKDIDQTIQLLTQLKALGVELAIDDFGTGYSSLSYLKRFPIHRLKVDRSFVMNMTENNGDAAITSTIIQLGHSMGLNVIAEGVETQAQVDFLIENNCDEFQGYFFSKPVPPTEFKAFVANHQPKRG